MTVSTLESRSPATARRIPPLRSGDHLTRDEFERRYEAMPEVNKAELIEGVVYMPSPVSAEDHGEPLFDFIIQEGLASPAHAAFAAGADKT